MSFKRTVAYILIALGMRLIKTEDLESEMRLILSFEKDLRLRESGNYPKPKIEDQPFFL
ncbi:MAG: hypothetical protein HQL68_04555 [Magnetococcales bacterium]|nr:hypothetical protein [Magnetococcales bacterium]